MEKRNEQHIHKQNGESAKSRNKQDKRKPNK